MHSGTSLRKCLHRVSGRFSIASFSSSLLCSSLKRIHGTYSCWGFRLAVSLPSLANKRFPSVPMAQFFTSSKEGDSTPVSSMHFLVVWGSRGFDFSIQFIVGTGVVVILFTKHASSMLPRHSGGPCWHLNLYNPVSGSKLISAFPNEFTNLPKLGPNCWVMKP